MTDKSALVLVTGGSGFIGFAVIQQALHSGYYVRAAVRRQDAIDRITHAPNMQAYVSSGALSFVIVEDNTSKIAYHEAAKGCSYIIHVASPLPTQPGDLIAAAIAGNTAVFSAAETTKTIKRVVFTGSIGALKEYASQFPSYPNNIAIAAGGEQRTAASAISAQTRVTSTRTLDLEKDTRFEWYLTSKTLATNMVDDYVEKNSSRHFSIVNIHPGFVLGPNPLSRNKQEGLNGSNITLGWLFAPIKFNMFYGISDDEPPVPVSNETVHINDVAEAHVNALDCEKVPGSYKNYVVAAEGPYGHAWESAADIVKKHYPEEVKNGKIPIPGSAVTLWSKYDAGPTEKELLGHPFIPFEKQVVDAAGWLMNLP